MIKKDRTLIGLGALILLIFLSVFLFWGLDGQGYGYILNRRFFRLLAMLVTALALALASAIFQTISNNRILTPSSLGLDSFYILIQTSLVFALGSGSSLIINTGYNFILSLGLMLVFSRLVYGGLIKKQMNIINLLLVGLILSSLFSSLSSFMQMLIDPNEFLHIQDNSLASFNSVNRKMLIISGPLSLLLLILAFRQADRLDVMALGRDQAINLGLDYEAVLDKNLFLVSALVALSTALVGPISFLGLMVVNLSRQLLQSYRHREVFILSSILAMIFLIFSQFLVERFLDYGAPVTVIINLFGGLYFIYLLVKENV